MSLTIDTNKSYAIQGQTLQDICDAVKAKTGDSTMPVVDLPAKIASLEGYAPEEMPKDVIFIDYDGTVIEQYDLADYRLLSPATTQGYTTNYVPTPPTHTGLTFQEWNYTDADITTCLNAIGCAVIGANYATDTGDDRFYIDITDADELALRLCIYPLYSAATITIAWGDGNTDSGSYSAGYREFTHTYAELGEYKIVVSCSKQWIYYNRGVLSAQSIVNPNRYPVAKCLRKIETGSNCYGFAFAALVDAVNLTSISMSTGCEYASRSYTPSSTYNNCGVTGLVLPRGSVRCSSFEFSSTKNLRYISFPLSYTNPGGITFSISGLRCLYMSGLAVDPPSSLAPYCLNLKRVVVGTNSGVTQTSATSGRFLYSSVEDIDLSNAYITTLYTSAFQYCHFLKTLKLPNTITAINASAFYQCWSLEEIDLSGCNLTSIAGTTFYQCYNCLKYDFTGCTTVPTLANTNAFTGINTNAKIVVPDNLVSSWKAASNWSTYASYIIGESDYNA